MRYFIELAYRGTAYNGWQIQPSAPSVQQTLQEALSKVLRQEIEVVGAGRTDTGVHAAYYVAHFDCLEQIEDAEKFIEIGASRLGTSRVVKAVQGLEGSGY